MAVYRDATPCARAIRAAYDFGQFVRARQSGALTAARPAGIDHDVVAKRLRALGDKMTEREAKSLLAGYGLHATQEALARDAEEAVALASKIGGKVVLKIDSPDIAHKTEAGGVRLNVEGAQAIREHFAAIVQSARAYAPQARINGILVQEMARPGVELMLGVIRDPVFGPIVAVGLGGIFVEVLKDVSYRVAPVTPLQAGEMLDELRGRKLLDGVRGMAPRDRDAVIDAIVRLSWFAHDFRDSITELDINPLIVYERGAGIRLLDALIVRAGG
jgi:acetyltransferase